MAATRKVDIVVAGNPYNDGDMLRGIETYAQRQGPWRFGLLFSGIRSFDERLGEQVRGSNADGLICTGSILDHFIGTFELPCPLVSIGALARPSDVPQVVMDDYAVGQLGATHLIERGLESFAFLGRPEHWSRARESGFHARLKQDGYTARTAAPADDPDARPGWFEATDPAWMEQWLRRLPPHAGVMTCQDQLANLLVETCDRIGLLVPTDVAVVSVDNDGVFCEFARTPVSSIDLDNTAVGYQAAALLDRAMTQGMDACSGQCVRIQPRSVVARQSTDLPLFRDPDLSRALHYMRQNATEGITVDDVVRYVAMSRRSFEQRFLQALGHPPAEELRRVRLEHARRLMTTSRMSLMDIAIRSGFSNNGNFSRAFKHAFGMNPRVYRKTHSTLG